MNLKGQGHSLTFANGHSVFKLKSFFVSKTIELFETKYLVKDFGSTKMKIYTNGLGHMIKNKRAWSHDQDGRHTHTCIW